MSLSLASGCAVGRDDTEGFRLSSPFECRQATCFFVGFTGLSTVFDTVDHLVQAFGRGIRDLGMCFGLV